MTKKEREPKKNPPATTGAKSKTRGASPSPEERYHMLQEAAYYLAEKDNFAGDPVGYWRAAEKKIGETKAS